MFGTIGMDSLRIAAVEALPLDMWEDTWLHWLGHLITGAIGNPEEEHAALARGSYSAVIPPGKACPKTRMSSGESVRGGNTLTSIFWRGPGK